MPLNHEWECDKLNDKYTCLVKFKNVCAINAFTDSSGYLFELMVMLIMLSYGELVFFIFLLLLESGDDCM